MCHDPRPRDLVEVRVKDLFEGWDNVFGNELLGRGSLRQASLTIFGERIVGVLSLISWVGWWGVAAGGSNSESERTVLCGSSNSRPLRSQTSPKAVSLAGERYQYHTGLRSTTFVKDINDVPSARLRAAWGILGMALPSVPKQHLV